MDQKFLLTDRDEIAWAGRMQANMLRNLAERLEKGKFYLTYLGLDTHGVVVDEVTDRIHSLEVTGGLPAKDEYLDANLVVPPDSAVVLVTLQRQKRQKTELVLEDDKLLSEENGDLTVVVEAEAPVSLPAETEEPELSSRYAAYVAQLEAEGVLQVLQQIPETPIVGTFVDEPVVTTPKRPRRPRAMGEKSHA